jgi:hypothetical protein
MSDSVQDRNKRFPDVDFNVNVEQMEKVIEAVTHASDRKIKDLAKEIKQARIDRDAIPHVTFPPWGSYPPAGRLLSLLVRTSGGSDQVPTRTGPVRYAAECRLASLECGPQRQAPRLTSRSQAFGSHAGRPERECHSLHRES